MLPGLEVVELRTRAAMRLKSPSSAASHSLNSKANFSAVQIFNRLQVVIGCLRRGIVPGNSKFGWNPAIKAWLCINKLRTHSSGEMVRFATVEIVRQYSVRCTTLLESNTIYINRSNQ